MLTSPSVQRFQGAPGNRLRLPQRRCPEPTSSVSCCRIRRCRIPPRNLREFYLHREPVDEVPAPLAGQDGAHGPACHRNPPCARPRPNLAGILGVQSGLDLLRRLTPRAKSPQTHEDSRNLPTGREVYSLTVSHRFCEPAMLTKILQPSFTIT